MGQRNRWAGTGWSRVPPERALVGNRFCPCPEWNGSGGRGCERPLNGKKAPGAPSCSTPALRRPFPRFIFKPHHHLLSSGYDARLPDAQTEAQRSAMAYLESRGPHSGGAAIWAQSVSGRVRKELCSKCARDAAFQRRREREESKTLSSVVLMLITRRSDVISDRLFFLCTF